MSKLPSFDDLDNNESEDNFSSIDELLKEFEANKNSKDNHQNDDLDEPNFNSDFESFVEVKEDEEEPEDNEWGDEELQELEDFQEPEVDYEDEIDNEDNFDISSHENSNESQENDKNDYESEDDYEPEDSEDNYESKDSEDNYESKDGEDDYEPEGDFMGPLLPGMNQEPEMAISEEQGPDNTDEIEDDEPETSLGSEKGADEKAKEIFDNLKNKVIGLFKPKKKSGSKKNKKPNKINREPKTPKRPKTPIKLNKNQKVILLSSTLAIVVLVVIIFLFMKSYSSLEGTNVNAKFNDKDFDEEIEVNIEILESNEKEITTIIKNQSDISATISSSLMLKEKSFIPFLGNKIQCGSDIIHVETDGEVKEIFSCEDEIDSTKKYKVNAEIDKF